MSHYISYNAYPGFFSLPNLITIQIIKFIVFLCHAWPTPCAWMRMFIKIKTRPINNASNYVPGVMMGLAHVPKKLVHS